MQPKKIGWYSAAALAEDCAASAWQRLSARDGAEGERFYVLTCLRLARRPGPPQTHGLHRLLVRRHCTDLTALACYAVSAPANTRLATLARVAGMCWTVEECFAVAKQEIGSADYEIRSWHGWYRHITLAMLALTFLVAMRVTLNAAHRPHPGQRHRLDQASLAAWARSAISSAARGSCRGSLDKIFAWSFWRRMHQAVAKKCHWQAR